MDPTPTIGKPERSRHTLQAADVVFGHPALQHRHQALENSSLSGAADTGPVEVYRSGNPVQDQITVSGDLRFDAEVHRGNPVPGVCRAKVEVLIDHPGKAPVPAGDETCAIKICF
jgi:hypothetical protein